MSDVVTTAPKTQAVDLVVLAREIAKDMKPLETILKDHQIDEFKWAAIQENDYFQATLASEISDWNAASNVNERVRLKSLHFVEEALPEFFGRAHDPRESLAAKTDVLKTVARLAGIGVGSEVKGGIGEKFSVTINLGSDNAIKIEKTIEGSLSDE